MFRKMCIRTRIMATFLLLLLINGVSILLLEHRLEHKLQDPYFREHVSLPLNFLLGTIMTGDLRSGFPLNSDYIVGGSAGGPDIVSIIKTLRIQVISVFSLTMVVGSVLSLLLSRSIAKPIIHLAHSAKGIANGKIEQAAFSTNCAELQVLTDSLRKMHEELLSHEEEKSRLESVEITKNLAAGIAHEIKNPINTVGLIVDYLQTNLSPDDPEKRYEFYKLSENMRKELRRINKIVEGFLRLTKPSVYNFSEEFVNGIINDTVSVLEPELVKNGVQVHLRLSPELPPVKADRDKLNQVFTNLIINAAEAMPRGGDITISTELKDSKLEIVVSDNGIGIPKENIKNIFNPYFSTKKQGFGLGLSIAQDIIHKHHGRLLVNSERGKGSDFIIQLPRDIQNE